MDLKELYQQVILDHNRSPKNFHELECPTHTAHGDNPFCGDSVTIYLRVENDRIKDISFTGHGCAISKAASSLMTEMLKGKSLDDADEIFRKYHTMVTTDRTQPVETGGLGKLAVLAGVREFPIRIKCASLPWHTMKAALETQREAVTTE